MHDSSASHSKPSSASGDLTSDDLNSNELNLKGLGTKDCAMAQLEKQCFTRVAIANRGEIACRIIESLKKLGLSSILLCAPADRNSRAAHMADALALLPSNDLSQSYLAPNTLIDAALNFQAQAIHPGYGFLSENAAFARAAQDAGLIWIGPAPDTIALMGDKKAAKAFAAQAGVPGVPGALLENSETPSQAVLDKIEQFGFPVLIKAAFGGGGRGMRKVHTLAELPDQIQQASREAVTAFGEGTVFIEKYIEQGRHIEVQILSDQKGNHITLGERDCSIQRRHQKVVEECPAECLSAQTRAHIHAAACALAKACQYEGAGTVEFIVTESGDFYFLEMNTRLQVEHPVTESVFDVDLVAWQIRIAQGEALPESLQHKAPLGHSIEVRWYAEDPAQNFLPQSGDILAVTGVDNIGLQHSDYSNSASPIRCDHQLNPPQTITPYYDPLLVKVIATGVNRQRALQSLRTKLSQIQCFGLQTNLGFLKALLAHTNMMENKYHTQWLETHLKDLIAPRLTPELQACLAGAISFFINQAPSDQTAADLAQPSTGFSPAWLGTFGYYAFSHKNHTFRTRIQRQIAEESAATTPANINSVMCLVVTLDTPDLNTKTDNDNSTHPHNGSAPFTLTVTIQRYNNQALIVEYDHDPNGSSEMPFKNRREIMTYHKTDSALFFNDQQHHYRAKYGNFSEDCAQTATGDELRAPCQAIVKALMVSTGDNVIAGQAMVAIEAMKIEQVLCSPREGVVASINIQEGSAITDGQLLITLTKDAQTQAVCAPCEDVAVPAN